MCTHIAHLHTETASTLVDNKRTALEDGTHLLILIIEIVESNEVLQQAIEVTKHMKEHINHVNIFSFFLQSQILCHDVKQGLLLVLLQHFVYFVNTQAFY